jgi:hypothetical protein
MNVPRGLAIRGVSLVCIGLILSGCAGTIQHLGIRPNEPPPVVKESACGEYVKYVEYAQQLQEAYHSRASHNRGWIYVAGVLGLGVVAASGGLAAAGAAGVGTLALLSIGGGFSAGAFATLDNSELADLYTISANRVDAALAEARKDGRAAAPYSDPSACNTAFGKLVEGVSKARIDLETARTSSAKGVLIRVKAQKELFDELKKELNK